MNEQSVVVEVLDHHNNVVQRVRVLRFPATIGRGYGCEVIVDDPHIAAKHLELLALESGNFAVRALPTRNVAMVEVGGRQTALSTTDPRELLCGPTMIRVGKTTLRIVVGEPAVAPEIALVERTVFDSRWMFVALGMVLFLHGVETWFGMRDEVKPSIIVLSTLSFAGVLLAWTGGWAFITRLLRGSTEFLAHVIAASVGLISALLLTWFIDIVSFALNWSALARYRGFLIGALAIAAVLIHLEIANGGRTRRMLETTLITGLAMACVALIAGYQSHKSLLPGGFLTHVLPGSWRVAGERTLPAFYEQAHANKAAVDALQKIESDEEGLLE